MNPHWDGRERRTCNVPPQVDCPQLEDAAERAVAKVFAILGVDVNKPESVEEFREDLRFGKRLRKITGHSLMVMAAVVAAAAVAALWSGISTALKRGA